MARDRRNDKKNPKGQSADSADTNDYGLLRTLGVDAPIGSAADDRLRRERFAAALTDAIIDAPADTGFVLGLVGPWGSGKTSILNMVVERLKEREDHLVLSFNPWLFSGTEQLVVHFFDELAAQLIEQKGRPLKIAGKLLHDYGSILKPFTLIPGAGSIVAGAQMVTEAVAQGLQAATAMPEKSLRARRQDLDDAIRKLGKRLVVVIDDIDRLRNEEIRDLMRLVKLTADFPDTVYVLAFDRMRVEQALSESYDHSHDDGRAYLEKILQSIYNVPEAPSQDLSTVLADGINIVAARGTRGPSSQIDLANVFLLIIRPLCLTVRDIRRYLSVLSATLDVIGDEVVLPDVLALEAVRILTPDVFDALPGAFDLLTRVPSSAGYARPGGVEEERKQLEELVTKAAPYETPVREFLRRIFPVSQRLAEHGAMHYGGEWYPRWRRERRVAHPEVFRFYLEKSLPPGTLPASTVQAAFEALTDPETLERIVSSLDERELEHLVGQLHDNYRSDFPASGTDDAARIFSAQLPRLPLGRRGFSDLGADRKLAFLLVSLLRGVASAADRTALIARTVGQLASLSARLWLIFQVGRNFKLIDDEVAESLAAEVYKDLLETTTANLSGEPDPFGLLYGTYEHVDDSGRTHVQSLIDDDAVLLAVLRSALLRTDTVAMGDAVGPVQYELRWAQLANMFGVDHLVARILALASADAPVQRDEQTLIALQKAIEHIAAAAKEQADSDMANADEGPKDAPSADQGDEPNAE